ncbi:Fic/DOC family protein [Desulfonispora thiosulfatigenes DSM 11270]|uniref:Fic/DOC family protein n=1 Tax=Desulfonispora thiosulfatigenes DSM 11270 TaxID=656914 RepID=A0A1W1VF04_DESTI|nr:Fic family protein [Desulfonispora thiosulfatigenes]SMB91800.1 Fic/DOC family protein [Desulfonispora thiosulfatigenes DSM 11270]
METKVVLESITVGGKTFREHLEIVNHKDTILYIEDIVKSKEELTEWQIKNIHRLILKGIEDKYAGSYREGFYRPIIFVGIHPFIDGNGRTSRLLLNLELMKAGYPPIIIRKENRLEYYNALDKAHTTKNNKDFVNLVLAEVNSILDLYLKYL